MSELCREPRSRCESAGVPHRHCVCLWPISPDQSFCGICWAEMLRGKRTTVAAPRPRRPHPIFWQGWGALEVPIEKN